LIGIVIELDPGDKITTGAVIRISNSKLPVRADKSSVSVVEPDKVGLSFLIYF